jgi:biopolymer transport protein ExbD
MDPALISVGPAGEVFLDSRPVRREDLPGLLGEIHRADPNRPVVLQADRGIAFRQVRSVFRMCQDAGMDGLSLRVSPPEQER